MLGEETKLKEKTFLFLLWREHFRLKRLNSRVRRYKNRVHEVGLHRRSVARNEVDESSLQQHHVPWLDDYFIFHATDLGLDEMVIPFVLISALHEGVQQEELTKFFLQSNLSLPLFHRRAAI